MIGRVCVCERGRPPSADIATGTRCCETRVVVVGVGGGNPLPSFFHKRQKPQPNVRAKKKFHTDSW